MTIHQSLDAVVVGAGFSGLYMTHLLKNAGFDVKGIERGSGVGGTWYWNRYPGCRCDVESMEYSYQFSSELEQEWDWPERYSAQSEILAYAEHVAERFDLTPRFQFETELEAAQYNDDACRWRLTTDSGETIETRYLIMATGCLSTANIPDFRGRENFRGNSYHTGEWPHEGVDFTGLRVGVIGTGSSGIQSIPLIADQAAELYVFQRTPNYSVPAQNRPMDPEHMARTKANYREVRDRCKQLHAALGADYPRHTDSVLEATPEEREKRFEEHWQIGGFGFLSAFGDLGASLEANHHAAEFVRNKIRAIVKDPETAELLCPTTPIGCKRLVADTGYFQTYNQEHVHLVDVSTCPIDEITPAGIVTNGKEYELDAIVYATGFDAMTGALLKVDVRGQGGYSLREKWAEGPKTYLGVMAAGFPNLFMMTGPGSPSVLANMITGAEQHAEFILELIQASEQTDFHVIDASSDAEERWVEVVNLRSRQTLYPQCNSWYLGANVPGKPRVFMPYIGFPDYSEKLADVRAKHFDGFNFPVRGAAREAAL